MIGVPVLRRQNQNSRVNQHDIECWPSTVSLLLMLVWTVYAVGACVGHLCQYYRECGNTTAGNETRVCFQTDFAVLDYSNAVLHCLRQAHLHLPLIPSRKMADRVREFVEAARRVGQVEKRAWLAGEARSIGRGDTRWQWLNMTHIGYLLNYLLDYLLTY